MNTARKQTLFRAGGIAALLAGILFRRNIGAEVDMFTVNDFPASVTDWFALLQNKPFIGLSFLAIFDLVNYVLIGLMFFALAVVLMRAHRKAAATALAIALAGIAAGSIANNALHMLSLSKQYAAASNVERAAIEAAGEALLARDGASGAFQGSLITLSLFLIAAAVMIFAILMLHSTAFGRVTATFGILASALDLLYCLTVLFAPTLAVILIAAAGLSYMIWHILVGVSLLKHKEL